MDEPGVRAHLREAKEDRHRRRHHVQQHLADVEPLPTEEADDIPTPPIHDRKEQPHASPPDIQPPAPAGDSSTAYQEANYRPPEAISPSEIPGATMPGYGLQGSAVGGAPEASQNRIGARGALRPHLQMMAGPMLRYDTVSTDTDTWYGFCMIVTADKGSSYDPAPSLLLRCTHSKPGSSSGAPNGHTPSDPHSTLSNGGSGNHAVSNGDAASEGRPDRIYAQKIYVYRGPAGSSTFWRFALVIPLAHSEMTVHYAINEGHENTFCVPAIGQNMRWVGHSCNGFSSGVNTALFNGPDPLWNEVLDRHQVSPYHCVVGGGDQIYCDALAKEHEIADWINVKNVKDKEKVPLTDAMRFAMDRFLFNHYCTWFRSGAFGKAISRIPMLNILDDHDLIDGFGSYPDSLQTSPVFSAIGSRGYFWYLLWQNFIVDDVDGTPSPAKETTEMNKPHSNRSIVFGGNGAYISFPSHNFLSYLGPQVYILLLDCRAERRKSQICSTTTYDAVFRACEELPRTVTHLVILLGVPIAYPRMVFIERALVNKANPALYLSRMGLLPGFRNRFNAEAELLDDCNDHWCAQTHKEERNWLILRCQELAKRRNFRVSFLSGDVHCASVGRLFTKGHLSNPEEDHRYMLNVISSAIVNTPPPPPLIAMMGRLGAKTHKTLWASDTDEDMIPVFQNNLQGKKNSNNPRIMGARNFASVSFIQDTGELEFDLRMETVRGGGKTKGYPVRAPPPRYSSIGAHP